MSEQVGGSHYKELSPEPLEVMKSWLGEDGYNAYLLGNVIKYVARYPKKGGFEDLRKARHYLQLRIGGKVGKEKASNLSIDPFNVTRAWLGATSYEAHLRADVIEYLGYYSELRDITWLPAALARLDLLIEHLA